MTRPMTEAEARAELKESLPWADEFYVRGEDDHSAIVEASKGATLVLVAEGPTLRAAVSAAIRAWQRAKVAR